MKTCRNKKGFSLAELLIVVAIIAVLSAVAIPIFTAQLSRSRLAANQANARSALAAVSTSYMTTEQTLSYDEIKQNANVIYYEYSTKDSTAAFVGITCDNCQYYIYDNGHFSTDISAWTVNTSAVSYAGGTSETLGSTVFTTWYIGLCINEFTYDGVQYHAGSVVAYYTSK